MTLWLQILIINQHLISNLNTYTTYQIQYGLPYFLCLYVYECLACMFICELHLCLMLLETRRGFIAPGTGDIYGYRLLEHSLKEQHVFLTSEPSPQSLLSGISFIRKTNI